MTLRCSVTTAVAALALNNSLAFSPLRCPSRQYTASTTCLGPTSLRAAAENDSSDASSGPTTGAGPRSSSSSSRALRRSGPRGERRPVPRSRQRPSNREPAVATKRAPHQYDHTKDVARPFVDTLTEISGQVSNEDAEPYDLEGGADLRKMVGRPRELGSDEAEEASSTEREKKQGDIIDHEHVQTRSLDDLFPDLGLSDLFSSSKPFRDELRGAMREDVFDTTPAYANLPEKARKMLLLPDSSLQGSWKCDGGRWLGHDIGGDDNNVRMEKLTRVLRDHLGPSAPTGDEFMDKIGALCGSSPTTHWIDIIGVTDRRIAHSWHQDTGRSIGGDTYTVMLGFPPEDNYDGVGVFSHAVKLRREAWADEGIDPPNEPVVYGGTVEEKYVVRPRFAKGREIIVYRDVDVIHSAPDVAYRASVMRFM